MRTQMTLPEVLEEEVFKNETVVRGFRSTMRSSEMRNGNEIVHST